MEKKNRRKANASRKKESDPTKPKRPMTAYFYYLANCRAENNRVGNAPLKVSEFSKIYAEKWKTLPPDEKKIYEDLALKDRERWLQETGKLNNGSDMKPKRPQSAYMMFLKDYRKNNSGKMKASALISKAAEEWRILSDVKKKVYTKQFLENQARYQQEKENYVNGKKDEVQLAKRPRIEDKIHSENFESEAVV
uniref:HMG box domain-containing protein n=2 Tax=Octopus bimaculoides TaxID=37653 RepID=A0A0L8HYJ9_OCTBM